MTDLLDPPTTLAESTSARRAGPPTDPPRSLPSPRPAPWLSDLPAPAKGDLPAPTPPDPSPRATRRKRSPGSSRNALLAVELLAVAAVVAAAVIAMFWSSALGQRNDAIAARDIAVAERDEAIRIAAQAVADQEVTTANLEMATAEIERLQGEINTQAADLEALDAQLGELTTQVSDLTSANAELTTRVAELSAQLATTGGVAADLAGEHPEFNRYVGELLTAISGPSPLTAEQQRCIGAAAIAAIGLDGLTTTAIAPATSEAAFALAVTTGNAADSCGIDRALIFG